MPARKAAARARSSRSRPAPAASAAGRARASAKAARRPPAAAFEGRHPLAKLVNPARELSHSASALARCSGSGRGSRRRSKPGGGVTWVQPRRRGGDPAAQRLRRRRVGQQRRQVLRPQRQEAAGEILVLAHRRQYRPVGGFDEAVRKNRCIVARSHLISWRDTARMSNPSSEPPAPTASGGAPPGGRTKPVVVKKYANRRLYNTATSSYVTLDDLARMIKEGGDFVVNDAKTGEDITRSVLTQIIVEQEQKGQNLLPISFLRQLIGFYGDSMQFLVPGYLEQAMIAFARNQEQIRNNLRATLGIFPFGQFEEMGKQNIALFERALKMMSPYAGRDDQNAASEQPATAPTTVTPSQAAPAASAETPV